MTRLWAGKLRKHSSIPSAVRCLSPPMHPGWLGDNPASCSVETRVSFPMGKQLVHAADPLPHLRQI